MLQSFPKPVLSWVFIFVLLVLAPQSVNAEADPRPIANLQADGLPLSFIPNWKQPDAEIQFQAQGFGGRLYFARDKIAFVLPLSSEKPSHILNLEFDGANTSAVIEGENQLPGVVNAFIGNDRSQWKTGIPTYGVLRYDELYSGIDLVYEGLDGALKGTYSVAAGIDPSAIAWRYNGAQEILIDPESGDLHIMLPDGRRLTEQAPVSWQVIGGMRVAVITRYELQQDNLIRFQVGDYDPAFPLTIDPTTQYSTYIGGSSADTAWGVAADDNGFAYVTGQTESADFPVSIAALDTSRGGGNDIFVVKINTTLSGAASKAWATYLGGSGGEQHGKVAVDPSGNVYVTGTTGSTDFPLTASGFQQTGNCCAGEAFLTKINPAGNTLLYSTYIGGSFVEAGYAVAADSAGNAYVVGPTSSNNFPVTGSAFDSTNIQGHGMAFVTKINTTASGMSSLVYSTYFGGNNASDNPIYGVAVDESGNVYITGRVFSTDLPVTVNAYQSTLNGSAGFTDTFVARFDTTQSGAASLVYSSYLGGSGVENYNGSGGIAADGTGIVYLTGETNSTDFPIVGGFDTTYDGDPTDAFVVAMDTTASGSASLIYSTYLGGSAFDQGWGIAHAGGGVVYITGQSQSFDFPLRFPIHPVNANYGGTFITKISTILSGNDSLITSTFLAPSGNGFGGIAVDSNATAFVSGQTAITDFPTTNGFQTIYAGNTDAFLFKLGFSANLSITQTASADPALNGENLTITASVKNLGADTATGVLMVDTLPANVTFVSATPDWGVCVFFDPDVVCDPGSIFFNETWNIEIVVIPQSGTQAIFSGEVSGNEKDAVPSNNMAVKSVGVVVFSDQIPTLVSPANGSSMLTNPITLQWNPVPGAAQYIVQFGSGNPPLTTTATVSGTSYTFPSPLPNSTFYWRVRGVSASSQVTQWSAVNSVSILSPTNGAVTRIQFTTTTTPTLTWNSVTDAQGYQLQVATNMTFTQLKYDNAAIPPGQLSDMVSTTLTTGTYYWRVRAKVNATTWGSWSAVESFLVNAP